MGTGGAPILGALALALALAPAELSTTPPPTCGALLSLVWAFFSLAPFLISPSRASLPALLAGGAAALGGVGGGGGGGIVRVWLCECVCVSVSYTHLTLPTN